MQVTCRKQIHEAIYKAEQDNLNEIGFVVCSFMFAFSRRFHGGAGFPLEIGCLGALKACKYIQTLPTLNESKKRQSSVALMKT